MLTLVNPVWPTNDNKCGQRKRRQACAKLLQRLNEGYWSQPTRIWAGQGLLGVVQTGGFGRREAAGQAGTPDTAGARRRDGLERRIRLARGGGASWGGKGSERMGVVFGARAQTSAARVAWLGNLFTEREGAAAFAKDAIRTVNGFHGTCTKRTSWGGFGRVP